MLTYGATSSPTALPSRFTRIPLTPAAAPACTAFCIAAGTSRKPCRSVAVTPLLSAPPAAGFSHQVAGMSFHWSGLNPFSVCAWLYCSIILSSHVSTRSKVFSFPSKAFSIASHALSYFSSFSPQSPLRQMSQKASTACCCSGVASNRAVRTGLTGPLVLM